MIKKMKNEPDQNRKRIIRANCYEVVEIHEKEVN